MAKSPSEKRTVAGEVSRVVLVHATTVGLEDFRRGQRPVREFLNDVLLGDDSHEDAAIKVLMHFCIENGAFNAFMPGLKLFLALANFHEGSLSAQQRERAIRDLKIVISSDATEETIRQWARSHYQSDTW